MNLTQVQVSPDRTSVPTTRQDTCYPLRSRVGCNQCQRRMCGRTRPGRRPDQTYTYYVCPHNPQTPRHAAASRDHIRASVREEIITAALAGFLDDYVPGRGRADML